MDNLASLRVIDRVNYMESINLIRKAKMILTDSGRITTRSGITGTPCITLRDRTEWIETVDEGVNFLAGNEPTYII